MPSNKSMFVPIRQQKVYTQIVEQIINLIERGEFKAGMQLPAERELGRSLGVSRASLREALTVLQMMGFVETRYGQGTFICAQPAPVLPQVGEANNFGESPFVILQARKAIEPSIAAFAAAIRTEEALAKLEEVLDWIEEDHSNVQLLNETFSDGDRRFHLEIANATNNSILINFQQTFFSLTGQKLWLTLMRHSSLATPGRWQEAFSEHRSIYEAIRQRDGQSAAARVRAHLTRVERIMVQADLISHLPEEGR